MLSKATQDCSYYTIFIFSLLVCISSSISDNNNAYLSLQPNNVITTPHITHSNSPKSSQSSVMLPPCIIIELPLLTIPTQRQDKYFQSSPLGGTQPMHNNAYIFLASRCSSWDSNSQLVGFDAIQKFYNSMFKIFKRRDFDFLNLQSCTLAAIIWVSTQ